MSVLKITMLSFRLALVVPAAARLRGLMDKAPPSELLCIFLRNHQNQEEMRVRSPPRVCRV